MKKGIKFLISIVLIIIIVLLIIRFSPLWGNVISLSPCAGQGEWYTFDNNLNPDKCCEGLENVHSTDAVSIADECYWLGTESGYPGGVCSDCGNGICEDVESVCGCAEDCIGQGKSDYATIQEYCDDCWNNDDCWEGTVVKDLCEDGTFDLPICNLC